MASKDQNISLVDAEMKIPKVFISYNHKDQEVALKIKDRLESSGIEVIIDVEAMATGENISEFIKKCIKESGITLSLISANSLMSAWVAMETIWSSYDETLRGRYFMPCNIDASFFRRSFTDQTLDAIDEIANEVIETMKIRFQKRRSIEDLTDEYTRLIRLTVDLPQIIGRLRNSHCVNISDSYFDKGIDKVILDIMKASQMKSEYRHIESETQTINLLDQPLLNDNSEEADNKLLEKQILIDNEQKKINKKIKDEKTEHQHLLKQKRIEKLEQMVFVKGGEFFIKNRSVSYNGNASELKLTVPDFFIGKYLVTQKQWTDIMDNNPSYFRGFENCPVEHVSWVDVQEFIQKLNKKTGKNYRLPTEAEWEYAARGGARPLGSMSLQWSGTNVENELGDYAWYDKNSEGKTHPVGTKKPNNLGIFDMCGNVWEWCQDYYDSSFNSTLFSPQGPLYGSSHVNRGGSWQSDPKMCSVEYRSSDTPNYRFRNLGFRLVFVPILKR